MNAELIQSHTKISELDAKVRGQEKCLLDTQKEMAQLQEENARLARDLKEDNTRLARDLKEENARLASDLKEENAQLARDLKEENARLAKDLKEENARLARDLKESEEKCRTVQEKWELAEQKLAQFLQKPIATAEESLAQVSVGSVGTMADSCCIAELKETIEKMNAELIQSHNKISELNAKVREQEECLSAARKEMRKLREENAQLARDLKEDNETNDDALDNNFLPNEIILKIFSYLTQNQLGQIARVCRRWNLLTKCPLLWKNVNVTLLPSHTYQYTVPQFFINRLPSCVSSIRLDFTENEDWIGTLCFLELCINLQQRCPHLEKLMLTNSKLYEILPSVIDLCTQFLHDVKNLVFHECVFSGYPVRDEFVCTSKIEVLDLMYCRFDLTFMPQFSKMPCLKVLCLSDTYVDDSWFKDDSSFLNQLQVLNVGNTEISAISFLAIQNHGHNLKELYLCNIDLTDHDFNFNNSTFPHLKTICLSVPGVTCEDVVSLIQSCPSLEKVYVDEDVAGSFAAHPFVVANRCNSGIVKVISLIHLQHN